MGSVQITTGDVVSVVLLVAVAISQVGKRLEPFWARFPDWLQALMPSLVLWATQVTEAILSSETELDGRKLLMLTILALSPGVHRRTREGLKTQELRPSMQPKKDSNAPPPPNVPPAGGVPRGLGVASLMMILTVVACSTRESKPPSEAKQKALDTPCDTAEAAKLGAECKVRVETECRDVPEERLETDCPVVAECDRKLDEICPDIPEE